MKLSERLRKGLAIKEKIGRSYCAAVIVAAGTSSRMGGTNKILTVLENLPVKSHFGEKSELFPLPDVHANQTFLRQKMEIING